MLIRLSLHAGIVSSMVAVFKRVVGPPTLKRHRTARRGGRLAVDLIPGAIIPGKTGRKRCNERTATPFETGALSLTEAHPRRHSNTCRAA